MTAYHIDCLLGPGINIHRHPLCGRNFEYFSEDPYIAGRMAAAMCRATAESGVYCTIKHFAGNNQEWRRHQVDAVMSARAAREIYLRPFEIAVREGDAKAIMTSYNPLNGIHASSNYDLATTILRDEWGYTGFVMTDWWATMNDDGDKADLKNLGFMIRSQGDVFMVVADAATNDDDGHRALAEGVITRGEVQRCAMNICRFLMNTHAMETFLANGSTYITAEPVDLSAMTCVATVAPFPRNASREVTLPADGRTALSITYHADAGELAQIPVSVIWNTHRVGFFMVRGTDGKRAELTVAVTLTGATAPLKLMTTNAALNIDEIKFYQ